MLPLADDLSVSFNQIVGDVSASQVLERAFLTDLHLDTQTDKTAH